VNIAAEKKKVADEQMFQTRKARILDEAVQMGLIDDSDNITHAEYLTIAKKIE
jgi:hypothetical protein